MIEKIFAITDFIDKARWGNKENYNLINFYDSNISNDTKILTHWLCYITDRQMAFERVWDVGGFVFSEMADQITKKADLELLNPQRPNQSFFIRRDDYIDKERYAFDKGDSEKFLFVSHQILRENEILLGYEFERGTKPYFISRYYPSDYISILSTFLILKDYEFSLSRYIIALLEKIDRGDGFVQKILFGLFLLSYFDIGKHKSADLIHFEHNLATAEKRSQEIRDILCDLSIFDSNFEYFKKDIIFKQKRAWCSLRDFLKSPEFTVYFFSALKESGFTDFSMLRSKDILKYLELPGDVWNNNPKFRKCIMRDTPYEHSTLNLPKLLRKIFNENRQTIKEGYPEQFDITFDFVSRMCAMRSNCSICPYELIHGKTIEFNKVCIGDKSKYCPIMYICCNYKMKCLGEDCLLLQYGKDYRYASSS
jgi:hypothetical protein